MAHHDDKYYKTSIATAIRALTSVPCMIELNDGVIETEEDFNTRVQFQESVNENNVIVWTLDKPEGVTWTVVKAKHDEIIAAYDALQWERNRKDEYPNIESLIVALYDTEDKSAIDAKRAEIKAKYPKS